MAPEVFRHEKYGPPVDVYAFSMIAYQMFTWRVPFEGMDPVQARGWTVSTARTQSIYIRPQISYLA